jgi:hypothetical protein
MFHQTLVSWIWWRILEVGMHWDWKKRQSKAIVLCATAAAGAFLLVLPSSAVAAPTAGASATPVTLRCSLHEPGSDDTIIQYYTVDSTQKTVSSGGDLYRIGVDPNGATGRVITRWSDTEITLVNEEWIRNGWQRFRIVTVLDRLTGAIRSEDINISRSGACTIADVAKKLF